jgi:hypothetical protein
VLPDLSTVGEFVPGYETSAWQGLGAPRNTPADIVEKLNKETNAGLADAKMKARLAVRTRVAVITGLAVLGYVVTVYLIFFLTYTPLNIDHVRGVQGRYFVIALPIAAIFLASVINSDLPRRVLATLAITGSLLSGITSFQALLGAHWSVP